MPYDEGLTQRVRELLDELPGLTEKKMFGGIAFMLHGNLACGILKNDLIVRVGPERFAKTISQPHTRTFDFTGRPMKGWIMISPDGYESDQDLASLIQQGVEFALSLSAK